MKSMPRTAADGRRIPDSEGTSEAHLHLGTSPEASDGGFQEVDPAACRIESKKNINVLRPWILWLPVFYITVAISQVMLIQVQHRVGAGLSDVTCFVASQGHQNCQWDSGCLSQGSNWSRTRKLTCLGSRSLLNLDLIMYFSLTSQLFDEIYTLISSIFPCYHWGHGSCSHL